MVASGQNKNTSIYNVNKIYLKKNVIIYNNYISVPYKKGDARVIISEILYKSTPDKKTGIKKIILP